jgi:pentatricopeptide repeat protein
MSKWAIVILLLLALISTSYVFAGEKMPILDGKISAEQAAVLAKHLSITSKFNISDRQAIKELDADIDKRLLADNSNPVLWFFKGKTRALLHYFRHLEMKQSNMTREQMLNDVEFAELKGKAVESYKHALNLDSQTNVPMKLNVIMLANIDRYVFSDADMQVEASRKMLARVKEHPEEHPPTEDWDFQIYGNIVTSYVDEKRYDEALAVLEEMKEVFPYPTTLKEIEDAIKRTKGRRAKAMQEAKAVEKNQVAESKPQRVQKAADKPLSRKVIPEPPKKQLKKISDPKPLKSDTNKAPLISAKLVIATAIMAVVILCVFIYFRRKKQ